MLRTSRSFQTNEGHKSGVPRAVLQVGRRNEVIAGGPTTIESSQNTRYILDSRLGATLGATKVLQRSIPSAGSVLRNLDRARTPESKIRVWSRSLDPIDSIGWLLSITVGPNLPAEGIQGGNMSGPAALPASASC
jgi:hypothetical protein